MNEMVSRGDRGRGEEVNITKRDIAKRPLVNQRELVSSLRTRADQCVRCGLCLPHCPTYQVLRDEAESPRGRIALIQGLITSQIQDSPRLRAHLDNCLECRACEAVCPSLVRFGRIMDDARALAVHRTGLATRLLGRAWIDTLSSRTGTRMAAMLSAFYRASGCARLTDWTGLSRRPILGAVHRLAQQVKRQPRLKLRSTEDTDETQALDLFLGCMGRAAQPRAIEAALTLLTQLGFRVKIPRQQACCGAMHRHNGHATEADRRIERNALAFNGRPAVGIASACVAELQHHEKCASFQEICRFLADLQWPPKVQLRPLRARVAVHEPCSQRNLLRDPDAAYDLLRRVPEIQLVPLQDNAFCCGAAGTYLLQHPEMSRTLLAPKIARLSELGVETLVTTNTGCAMHFAAGIAEAGLAIRVQHPIELIASRLAG